MFATSLEIIYRQTQISNIAIHWLSKRYEIIHQVLPPMLIHLLSQRRMEKCTRRTRTINTLVAFLMGSKAVLAIDLLRIDSARVLARTIKPFEISFGRNFGLTFLLIGRNRAPLPFQLTLLLPHLL